MVKQSGSNLWEESKNADWSINELRRRAGRRCAGCWPGKAAAGRSERQPAHPVWPVLHWHRHQLGHQSVRYDGGGAGPAGGLYHRPPAASGILDGQILPQAGQGAAPGRR